MAYYIKGKGWFESSGKPMGSARKIDMERARVMGAENDTSSFTRLLIESRVSAQILREMFLQGRQQTKGAV